jgi:hypothetical protein
MASRTYLPALRFVLHRVCKYIARYRDQIIGAVGAENTSKVDAVVTACNVLMAVLDVLIPSGS